MLRCLKLILPMFISLLFNNERGWTHPQTGWEVVNSQNMAFYFIQTAYLDNVELEGQQEDVIGVFFNDQCIGWGFYNSGISSVPTTGDDGTMPAYPTNGDSITFKFYDYSNNQIVEAVSNQEIPVWEENQFFNILRLNSCSPEIPMTDNGTCIINCMGDSNLDGQVDVIDVVEIINLIINCLNPPYCHQDYLQCTDYNNDQNLDILDVILIVESII